MSSLNSPIKTFHLFLNEVFNQSYEIKMIKHTDDTINFIFNTSEGKKGLIMFNRKMSVVTPEHWIIDFSINTKYNVTGGGEAFSIFSTVLTAIKEFLKLVDAKIIKFSAAKNKSDSRSSLYSTLVKKFAKSHGYDFDVKDSASSSNYILTKAT